MKRTQPPQPSLFSSEPTREPKGPEKGAVLLRLTSDSGLFRVDDKYWAGNMLVFYLTPIEQPHREGGELYEFKEIDTLFSDQT